MVQSGDVCELCALGADPYAQVIQGSTEPATRASIPDVAGDFSTGYTPSKRSRKVLLSGGAALANQDPYGNSMMPAEEPEKPAVQVYKAGQSAVSTQPVSTSQDMDSVAQTYPNGAITSGITKNIVVDTQSTPLLQKWFRSLVSGVPFPLDNDITMFQVFPDYSGTSTNAQGNACDQVIVYGKMNAGAVSENNAVEVYGRRDSSNNVIAKSIRNVASSTTVTPYRTLPAALVWIITLAVIAPILLILLNLGIEGIVWAVVLIICLMNFPLVLKIVAAIFGIFHSIIRRLLR